MDELRDNKQAFNRLKYVLPGPDRWGTRDKHLGIPVVWPQISNAKVIVEVSLPWFHVDASLGSHADPHGWTEGDGCNPHELLKMLVL